MSAPTPGPWSVYSDEHRYPGVEAKCGTVVIFGFANEEAGVRGATQETAMANAHLIAAAPDLLDACLLAVAGLPPDDATRKQIEAAIAKAEGRTTP